MVKARVLMPVFNEIDFDSRVQRAAEVLSRDYEVTVLAIDSGHAFAAPTYRTEVVSEIRDGSKVFRHLRFCSRLFGLTHSIRPHIIHAHDFFMAGPGWLAARSVRARLVYDAHEIMISDPAHRRTRRERLFSLVEGFVARHADLVLSVTPEAGALLQRYYRLPRLPLPIPNRSAAPTVFPSEEMTIKQFPQLAPAPGKIRLVYAGDMDRRRGIADFINAMPHLEARFELVLMGDGPDVGELQTLITHSSARHRIHFFGRVPRDLMFAIMRLCTIGIVTYAGDILAFKHGSSNKVFEYQFAGLPLLVTHRPVLDRLLASARSCRFIRARADTASDRNHEIVAAVKEMAASLTDLRAGIAPFLADNDGQAEIAQLRQAYGKLIAGMNSIR